MRGIWYGDCSRLAHFSRRRSVHDHCSYDYAVVRVVPRVEREEFVNVGIILSCQAKDFLEARIELDEKRVLALDPDAGSARPCARISPASRRSARAAPRPGQIGRLSQRERFHWLVAPRSTVIQTSAVHTGRCTNLPETLEHLLNDGSRDFQSRLTDRY